MLSGTSSPLKPMRTQALQKRPCAPRSHCWCSPGTLKSLRLSPLSLLPDHVTMRFSRSWSEAFFCVFAPKIRILLRILTISSCAGMPYNASRPHTGAYRVAVTAIRGLFHTFSSNSIFHKLLAFIPCLIIYKQKSQTELNLPIWLLTYLYFLPIKFYFSQFSAYLYFICKKKSRAIITMARPPVAIFTYRVFANPYSKPSFLMYLVHLPPDSLCFSLDKISENPVFMRLS